MFVRIIKTYRDIVAVCDSEILGKTFEEDEFQLEVKESFFKGEETSEEETEKIMKDMKKEDATFNIVGEKSVKTALKSGIISEDQIKKIQDVPYSLILM